MKEAGRHMPEEIRGSQNQEPAATGEQDDYAILEEIRGIVGRYRKATGSKIADGTVTIVQESPIPTVVIPEVQEPEVPPITPEDVFAPDSTETELPKAEWEQPVWEKRDLAAQASTPSAAEPLIPVSEKKDSWFRRVLGRGKKPTTAEALGQGDQTVPTPEPEVPPAKQGEGLTAVEKAQAKLDAARNALDKAIGSCGNALESNEAYKKTNDDWFRSYSKYRDDLRKSQMTKDEFDKTNKGRELLDEEERFHRIMEQAKDAFWATREGRRLHNEKMKLYAIVDRMQGHLSEALNKARATPAASSNAAPGLAPITELPPPSPELKVLPATPELATPENVLALNSAPTTEPPPPPAPTAEEPLEEMSQAGLEKEMEEILSWVPEDKRQQFKEDLGKEVYEQVRNLPLEQQNFSDSNEFLRIQIKTALDQMINSLSSDRKKEYNDEAQKMSDQAFADGKTEKELEKMFLAHQRAFLAKEKK